MTDQATQPSPIETIKERSAGLRGTIDADLESDAPHLTADGRQVIKFHGVYEQDDRDARRSNRGTADARAWSFMVRAKIPGGVLSADQYLVFDDLADRAGNGTLRLTTRQDIQLHGVIKHDLRATVRSMNETLVTTLGACGDVVRNVTCCPAPLGDATRDAALRAARAISDRLLPRTPAYHEIWLDGERLPAAHETPAADPVYGSRYLPRKFKVGIGLADDNCCEVHSNDVGLLAVASDDGIEGFDVLVGGGLGTTHGKSETFPRLATPLAFVAADDVTTVVEAIVGVHRDFGDRTNRRHARLKYLVEERGIDWVRAEVEERLGRRLASPRAPRITGTHDHLGWHAQADGRWFVGVFVENGRVLDASDLQLRTALRRVARDVRPGVVLTPQQNVLLTGIGDDARPLVDRILADHGVPPLDGLALARRWAMACPALPTCGLAIAEAERVMPGVLGDLERELTRLGLHDVPLTVRMTGCPNGCARPYTADIAFIGRSADRYTILIGGSRLGTRLAHTYKDLVRRDDLVATLVPLLEEYGTDRRDGESFGDYIARRGPEPRITEGAACAS